MKAFMIVSMCTLICAPAPIGAEAEESVGLSRRTAIVRAIEQAAPAVVSINLIEVEAERILEPFSRDFWGFFQFSRPRYVLHQRELNSVGSGFFIDDKGHLLTNCHVIEGADAVASVTLADGRILEVELVGVDQRSDLAVLRAKGSGLPRATLGSSDDLMTGEWVIAIGNPFGPLMKDPQPTASVGVVSATHRRVSPGIGGGERMYQDMIQTDAAINPGNSGGPLVNAQGRVVGVNTMIFSQSGGSVGLGFAIPVSRARRVADELIRYGRRRDPWPGFKVEDIRGLREDFLRELDIRVGRGCVVINILTRSPAHDAGLRPGDVIMGINGQTVDHSHDLDFGVWGLFVGDTVTLDIARQDARTTITFPVEELAE